ncbi:uncharacterized protein LOC106664009 [Cimex lectularius]|uniref:Uncharacterized protein n=1 Tax=Cimex lectularius TaxID=79782 RepID=A0A8I6TEW4_CIMLE|nr:uncharacterized protein LOC106664009 [Cimex lectularius]
MTHWRVLAVLSGLICQLYLVMAIPMEKNSLSPSGPETETLNKNKTADAFIFKLPSFTDIISNAFESKFDDISLPFNPRTLMENFFEPEDKIITASRSKPRSIFFQIFSPFKSYSNREEIPVPSMFDIPIKNTQEFEDQNSTNNIPFQQFFPDVFLQMILSKANQTETGGHISNKLHKQCTRGHHCNCAVIASAETGIIRENPRKLEIIDKNFLICILPALLGLVVVVTGVEIIRRHKAMVKQARCQSQFGHVQHC